MIRVMKTFKGVVKKEEFMDDEFYFLDVQFQGCIYIDKNKFIDVYQYIDKEIEVETIEWDYLRKGLDKYRVIGIKK